MGKLQLFTKAIDMLYAHDQRKQSFIDSFQKLLQPKATRQFVKQKIQDVRVQLKNQFQLQLSRLRQALKDLQSKNNKNCQQVQNKLKETEKKTIGKISECELLLSKKATVDFVNGAVEQLDSKITFDLKNLQKNGAGDMMFKLNELKRWSQSNIKECVQSNRDLRNSIKEMDQTMRGLERKQKAQGARKQFEGRIHQIGIKVLRLQSLHDSELQERINRELDAIKSKLNDTYLAATETSSQFNDLMKLMSQAKGQNVADPHKICMMDAELKRVRDTVGKHTQLLGDIQNQTRMKLMTFEEKIMANLALIKNQESNVSKDQLHAAIGRLRETTGERLNQITNTNAQINKRLAKSQIFERATKKKIKQLLANQDNKRMLADKMDTIQGRSLINQTNSKLSLMQEWMERLKVDNEGIIEFISKLQQSMGNYEQGISIISGKQKIVPQKCISCGVKHRGNRPPQEMMGTDGKFYKVDLKNCAAFDQQEVYDVMPSQITYVPFSSFKGKQRISSAKQRSGDSGLFGTTIQPANKSSLIRPQSAKKT